MILRLTTPEKHLRYVSLALLVPLPATVATPLLTGLIVSRWGYAPAFGLGAVLSAAAFVVATGVRTPQGGKNIHKEDPS